MRRPKAIAIEAEGPLQLKWGLYVNTRRSENAYIAYFLHKENNLVWL